MSQRQIKSIPKIPKRKPDSHKGTYGKVLIIGGSLGMAGAPALAAKAALRTGSGLVRVGCPESILPTVAGFEPCYTTIPLCDGAGLISSKAISAMLNAAEQNDAIAIGMGMGESAGIRDIIAELIKIQKKIVIDADGLNNLCRIDNWFDNCRSNIILTPHPGEAQRLWQSISRSPMPKDRLDTAKILSDKTGIIILLKGSGTIVCGRENFYINTTGNPGMATAGSGDVLSGMIASFAAQGFDVFDAAVLGAFYHGRAGDKAAQIKGQPAMIATDIIDNISIDNDK